MKSDDAWHLIKSGRYDEAAQQLERHINAGGIHVELGHFGNKSVAELAAGRMLEAERTLKESQVFAERQARGSNLLLKLSELQWLNGHTEEAIESLRARIRGLQDGTVQFTDAAGGAKEGLILYYYGVRLDRDEVLDEASQWLNRVRKRRQLRLKVWPGPLVLWFFGELDDSAILSEGCETTSIEGAVTIARSNILIRRQLIEICFHQGVRAMREGDGLRCKDFFENAACLENPLVELEWYLARHEVDRLRRLSN